MTRPIKFRAWDREEEKMWTDNEVGLVGLAVLFDGRIWKIKADAGECGCESLEFNPPILMQFTGLLDKNGKEIYEGDVVKGREGTIKGAVEFGAYTKGRSHKHDSQTEHVGWYVQEKEGKVSLEDLEWYIKPDNYAPFRGAYLEVIGNVMENPDLLK